MAERNAGGGGGGPGGGGSNGSVDPREHRRASSRREPPDPDLPPEFLAELEKKRKQLDDSIHKYIAARERDYKNFERELRVQLRIGKTAGGATNGPTAKTPSIGTERNDDANRNISSLSESARRSAAVPAIDLRSTEHTNRAPNSSDALIAASRNAACKKDALIGSKAPRQTIRMSSAPDLRASMLQAGGEIIQSGAGQGSTKQGLPGKSKRPSHISLTGRTSSSGSSVEGRLMSALKSPSQRPKGKRVSLQVGDEIVAPSTPVPQALTRTSSSSHSRTNAQPSTNGDAAAAAAAAAREEAAHPSALQARASAQGASTQGREKRVQAQPDTRPADPKPDGRPPKSRPPRPDAEVSFFDLDEEEFATDPRFDSPSPEPDGSNDEDIDIDDQDTIAGRIDPQPRRIDGDGDGVGDGSRDHEAIYDPEGGTILPTGAVVQLDDTASQQPSDSGFRKPSVIRDPVFSGSGSSYEEMEQDAVLQDVYGSSYSRVSKSSFNPGSLGESFMERNAEEMIKKRAAAAAKPETQ